MDFYEKENKYELSDALAIKPQKFWQIEFYYRLTTYKFAPSITLDDRQLIFKRVCEKIPEMKEFDSKNI